MMRCRTFVAILALGALVAPPALWADPVDASTPQAALKSLYAAVNRADPDAIVQTLVVDQDPEQELVKLYAGWIVAGKRLADAARAKFPGSNNALAVGTISTEDATKINAAVVTIEGEVATLKLTPQAEPIKLRSYNGAWRVLIGEGTEPVTPQRLAERRVMLQNLIDAMNVSADEVNADKYATVADAESVVKDRLGAVLAKSMQVNPATRRATTRP